MYKYIYILILSFITTVALIQAGNGPVSKYTFNNGKAYDEIRHLEANAIGISFVDDRFGNPEHACYLHGNYESYLNLGTSPDLKPINGSISLWIKIENIVYKGDGLEINPFILTKSHSGNDFYEGYFLGINMNSHKVSACSSFDETHQVSVWSRSAMSSYNWYHLVLAYDDEFMWLYLDNQLEVKMPKKFRTQFMETDSVMIGNTANSKNKRFLNASVDDIEIFDHVLTPSEVNQLYYAPDSNRYRGLIKLGLFILAGLLMLAIAIGLINLWYRKKLKKIKQQNELLNRNREMEIRVIKAQMNPHFIFNSLNSIQHFIVTDNKDKAQLYLSKFSKLIRKLLESNTNESISLSDEVDLLTRYLEIESLRFSNTFSYSISFEGKMEPAKIFIPHLLVQPFVENAIWHGLLPKEGEKKLDIKFSFINEKVLSCTIDDNGIGRETQEIKKEEMVKQKSLAIHFIRQRLELMSTIYNAQYGIEIIDKKLETQPAGTEIILRLPIINNSYVKSDNH